MSLSVALVVPFPSRRVDFFPDTLLGILCTVARRAGHRAALARVFYEGDGGEGDREVRDGLVRWLGEREADLVVLDRPFDPGPVRTHVAGRRGRLAVLVSRGDPFDLLDGVDLVVGHRVESHGSCRTATVAELVDAFERLLEACATGASVHVPGVRAVAEGRVLPGAPPLAPRPRPPPLPTLEHDVVSAGPPPPLVRRTVFGNSGCPYGADVSRSPHHAGVSYPPDASVARAGCAFCAMGGDYEGRPPELVAGELVAQAVWITRGAPEVEELVLVDQHPLPYLARAIRAAPAAGARPVRWLFAARPDVLVRRRGDVEDAIAAAEETDQAVELHLVGFEAFCDRELERYHKGLRADDLLAAVALVRRLGAAHPRAFAYARARGHSLLLWNPWTTCDDLVASVRALRTHGLVELFTELGGNRLRLYPELPITYAAARDGALVERWEEGPRAARGYAADLPWRFLDPRTRLAHDCAEALRDRLGREGELAQLAAAVAFAVRAPAAATADPAAAVREVLRGLEALATALARLDGTRGAGDPPRGASARATPVLLAGACNDGCVACAQGDVWLDDSTPAVLARVTAARGRPGALVFAGREPTIHPGFAELVAAGRGPEGRAVGLVTNGRRFADAAFSRAFAPALSAVSVKLFAADAAVADAIARAPGAYAQAVAGARALAAAGTVLEVRTPLHALALDRGEASADEAQRAGAQQVRLEAALDAVGLDGLSRAAEAVERLAHRCAALGVPLDASPLSAGTRLLDRIPVRLGTSPEPG